MKKLLLTSVFAFCLSTFTFAQWVSLPTGAIASFVNIHDVDVTGTQMTLEALVSVRDTTLSPHDILSKHSGASDANYILRHNLFSITTGSSNKVLNNPWILCPDSVYHVAATYDGANMNFYVNGELSGTRTCTGTLANNNWDAAIGNRWIQQDEQFKGYIDEVRIWNVVRTAVELSANMYNLPNPTTQTGLLAYYKFDGNYTNAQGTATWNGTATGTNISLATNPYFLGAVSNCGPVGIPENSSSSIFRIFPNPSHGNFIVDISGFSHSQMQLTVSNILGEKVKIVNLNLKRTEIGLEQPAGIYFLTLSGNSETHTMKIIIQ
jgi:hypothetical protein